MSKTLLLLLRIAALCSLAALFAVPRISFPVREVLFLFVLVIAAIQIAPGIQRHRERVRRKNVTSRMEKRYKVLVGFFWLIGGLAWAAGGTLLVKHYGLDNSWIGVLIALGIPLVIAAVGLSILLPVQTKWILSVMSEDHDSG